MSDGNTGFSAFDRWCLAALTLASVLLAVPLLTHAYLPFLDLPQHVGAVAILSGSDAAWRLHDYYEIDLLGSPYLLPYLVAAGLAKVLGPVAAVKTMFAVAAAALPWSVAWAASRFGRDPRIGLVAAPVAYGTFAFMGFLNFVLSLPLWLLWLGWWRGAVDAERFGPSSWVTGAVLSVVLFYGHVMTLGFAAGCCVVIAVLADGPGQGGRDRAGSSGFSRLGVRLTRALHFLPGLGLFVAWAGLSKVSKEGELGRMLGADSAVAPPKWDPPLDALKSLLDYTLSTYTGDADEWLLLAMVALAGLLWIVRRGRDPEHAQPWWTDKILVVLLLSALGLAVVLPSSYRGIWPIGARMAPFVVLLALLLPGGRIVVPRLAIIAGLLLTGFTAQTHDRHFAAFNKEVGPLEDVIAQIEPGRRTMTLVFDNGSQVVRWPAFLHFSQYVIAEKGGVSEFSFVNFTKSPIHYADLNAPPRNPVRFEWTPDRFRLRRQQDYWDYVLLRGPIFRADRCFEGMQRWAHVHSAGPWHLFARPAAETKKADPGTDTSADQNVPVTPTTAPSR